MLSRIVRSSSNLRNSSAISPRYQATNGFQVSYAGSRSPLVNVSKAILSRRSRDYSTAAESPNSKTKLPLQLLSAALLVAVGYGLAKADFGQDSQPAYASVKELQQAIAELQEALPGKVTTETIALDSYGSSSNSYHPSHPHSVVVHAQSTEDVVAVVNIARKYRVPIVPYGGATSLEGHYSGV